MIQRKPALYFMLLNALGFILVAYLRTNHGLAASFANDAYLAMLISLMTSVALFALSFRSPS